MKKYSIEFEDGSKYIGQVVLSQPNGSGKYSFANGDYFDGLWLNGLPHGKGFYLYNDLHEFYGTFKNGLKHGEGILYDKNGKVVHQGNWINGLFEGKFNYKDPNEQMFYKEEQAKGNGAINISEKYAQKMLSMIKPSQVKRKPTNREAFQVVYDNGTYYGPTLNGGRHGFGVYVFNDGSIWYANFVNNKASGKGRYVFADGSYYLGNYTDSKKNGVFEVYSATTEKKTNTRYIMNQKETMLETGDFYCLTEGKINFNNGDYFEGLIKNNKFPSYGDYFHACGDKYSGDFFNQKRHGKGVYTWKDGRKFEGEWFSDAKHGFGTFTNAKGEAKTGEWFDDVYEDRFEAPTPIKLESLVREKE